MTQPDNVIDLGADAKAREQMDILIADMCGPERRGCALIVDGRAIPNITIRDAGDRIWFTLDDRFGFEFPREWAHQAASFAANAMAIGAGYAFLGSETRERPFAPQCMAIELGASHD